MQIVKSGYETMIFTFRAKKVMVDSDLAILYEVQTKRLKEQVKRNITRFPEDFMFELSKNLLNALDNKFTQAFNYLLSRLDELQIENCFNPYGRLKY